MAADTEGLLEDKNLGALSWFLIKIYVHWPLGHQQLQLTQGCLLIIIFGDTSQLCLHLGRLGQQIKLVLRGGYLNMGDKKRN